MQTLISASQVEHRSVEDDRGAAIAFYFLSSVFALLFALILWYFPGHV